MQIADAAKHARRSTNLSLDTVLLAEAKALGLNVSRAAEAGIAEAVQRSKRQQWLRDNSAAMESSNRYVDANGLPLARHRRF